MCNIYVHTLPHAQNLPLPRYMTADAAGMDLLAAINEAMLILPKERKLIPTGLQIAVTQGFEAQIRPRSGLALKYGISVLNSPGTIDADYRGEVKIILANFGTEPFLILRGDRIAQLVLAKVAKANLIPCIDLPTTIRDKKGFGHTGL